MTALAPVAPRLALLLPRLASDHDGEIVATVRAVGAVLARHGLDWHDLAAAIDRPPAPAPRADHAPAAFPDPGRMVRELHAVRDRLTGSDREFLESLARRAWREPFRVTPKQEAWVRDLWRAYLAGGGT